MTPRNWLLALALTGLMPVGVGIAQPNPLERVGRLHGICWGDGYHACKDSGTRLLADLPPAPRTVAVGSRHVRILPTHDRKGATFYDRFDAMNQSDCDSAACPIVDRSNPSPAARLSRTPRMIAPIYAASKPSYVQIPAPQIPAPLEMPKTDEMPELNRPRRLGTAALVVNSVEISTESPIEFAGQSVRTNPNLGRPTVEMAKRISDSETGFVRQPSYLK